MEPGGQQPGNKIPVLTTPVHQVVVEPNGIKIGVNTCFRQRGHSPGQICYAVGHQPERQVILADINRFYAAFLQAAQQQIGLDAQRLLSLCGKKMDRSPGNGRRLFKNAAQGVVQAAKIFRLHVIDVIIRPDRLKREQPASREPAFYQAKKFPCIKTV